MTTASCKEREEAKPRSLGSEVWGLNKDADPTHPTSVSLKLTYNETKILARKTTVTEGRFQRPALQGLNRETRQEANNVARSLTTGKKKKKKDP